MVSEYTIGAIVVCRYDSSRLPGKILADVIGKPLIWYIIERCRSISAIDKIIIATSERSADDVIAKYAQKLNIDIYRGDYEDVAGRVLSCSQENDLDFFYRVNGDSPFIFPALLEEACRVGVQGSYDLVTNLSPRSFPYGMSVEFVKTSYFAKQYRFMDDDEKEHVTKRLYKCIDKSKYYNILRNGDNLSHIGATVDRQEDLDKFRGFIAQSELSWVEISEDEFSRYYLEKEAVK